MLPRFFDSVLDLIVRTSTDLPPDVRAAMKGAMNVEQAGTKSSQALNIIALNIDQAADAEGAICQDTGMPTFEVHVPRGADQIWMRAQIRDAVAKATSLGKLRPNSVDSITGENSGDNLGPGTPIIHFDQWEEDEIEVKLILKGGGCENMNIQYSLPSELPNLGRADRTLEGVRKCILHAVWQAQGKGCAPARSACASAGIARQAPRTPRSSSSEPSTTSTPTAGWPISKRTSWARSTRSASARWDSAAPSA
jgi:fumarate hydratase class I